MVRLGPYRLGDNHFLEKTVSVMDVFVRGRFRTEKTKEHSRKLRHNTAIIRLKEPVDFDHLTRSICLTGAFDSIRSEITGSRGVHFKFSVFVSINNIYLLDRSSPAGDVNERSGLQTTANSNMDSRRMPSRRNRVLCWI